MGGGRARAPRETELLAPRTDFFFLGGGGVQQVDALVLSGGSAFGLDAAFGRDGPPFCARRAVVIRLQVKSVAHRARSDPV